MCPIEYELHVEFEKLYVAKIVIEGQTIKRKTEKQGFLGSLAGYSSLNAYLLHQTLFFNAAPGLAGVCTPFPGLQFHCFLFF